MNPKKRDHVYGPVEWSAIEELTDPLAPPLDAEQLRHRPDLLAQVEVIFGGWNTVQLDSALLAAAPQLDCIFYAAGSVKSVVTDASWARGVRVTTAAAINAVPVAEFTLSQILFCLKCGWQHVTNLKLQRKWQRQARIPGAYESTVGIISLGQIGQLVCERLRGFDVRVIAHDPYCDDSDPAALGVKRVGLDEVFDQSDVVSIHSPRLPETMGMIQGRHLRMMKQGASLINTSRGAVIQQDQMIEVLQERPDLVAVLDVTDPEPPDRDSPLWDLPNAIMTPHIAGSKDDECRRMGRSMIEECRRYVKAEPLRWELTHEMTKQMA